MNQSYAGSNSTNSSMDIDRGYHHNPLRHRITAASSETPIDPSSQVVSASRGIYDHRTHPYRDVASHQPVGFATPVADGRQPVIEVVPPPRHSRPLPTISRTSERNGRSRGLYDRFQPFLDGNNAYGGWVTGVGSFFLILKQRVNLHYAISIVNLWLFFLLGCL